MTPKLLTRADWVKIHKLQYDYHTRDVLPHPEQIRYDAGYLINLVLKLDAYISRVKERV